MDELFRAPRVRRHHVGVNSCGLTHHGPHIKIAILSNLEKLDRVNNTMQRGYS